MNDKGLNSKNRKVILKEQIIQGKHMKAYQSTQKGLRIATKSGYDSIKREHSQ